MTPRPTQSDGRVHGVIVGCYREDGRWLIIRRSEKVAAPNMLAFPGGAVEPGENREIAAIRELREELGTEVELVEHVWHHVFDDKPLTLWGYLAKMSDTTLTPDPHEVAEIHWLTADELSQHPDALPFSDTFAYELEAARNKHIQNKTANTRLTLVDKK